ncbi:MAG: HAD family hydrolase [Butyrivibrio sp.]|nr:HAD family hydrolase [Acetatifactor muris]MCM1561310.1 HAD family hydrolase [Butyrivibrio sp.]
MLIFFDIDGTLVGEDGRMIPESAGAAVQRARANGHVCMINTGRTLTLVGADLTGQTEFDGLILGCGTMVLYRGKTLMHETFSPEEGARIIDGLYRYEIDACLEGSENNYRDSDDRIFAETYRKFINRFGGFGYGSFQEAMGHFDKFYAYTDKTEKMDGFRREFEDRLDFVDRKGGFFEIMPKGYSKASAMDFVAEKLGIPMEETVAIGDSSNDIPMIERAHIGIAMGNATEDVKKAADYVSTDIHDNGIKNALQWLGAI